MKSRKTSPEKLISAVKKHPCIWNGSCEKYKINKENCWNTVASEVIDGWKDFNRTEKHDTTLSIIRRWNNIRDYYSKSLKAHCHAKLTGESCIKNYVFADALKFLRPELERDMSLRINNLNASVDLKVENSETEEEDILEVEEEEEEAEFVNFVDTTESEESNHTPSKKQQQQTLECNKVVNENTEQDDPDLTFLKSLLPDMKNLADDEKFAFKDAIMQAYMVILKKRNE